MVEQSAWPRGIDQKLCVDGKLCAIPCAVKTHARFTAGDLIDFRFVEIGHSQFLSLLDEKGIEVSSEPMCVCNSVMWACGNEKLIFVGRFLIVRLVELVVIEREAALEAACDIRVASLPAPPFCERCDSG